MDGIHGRRPYGAISESGGNRSGGRIRTLVGAVLVVFVATLAIVIGQRLSDQAMAVLAGAVCGVGASIPTSLLIVWVTRRRQEQRPPQAVPGPYPPVVVVQPPAQVGGPNPHQPAYLASYGPPTQRDFTVVGGDMEEVSLGDYQ